MKSKRKLFLVIITLVLASLLVISAVVSRNNGANEPDHPPAVELEGPGTVVIDNTDRLGEIMLSEQYTVVVNQLIKYIQAEIDPGTTHATIVEEPKIDGSGKISFTVKTDSPEKVFNVVVDRNTYFDKLIFTVQGENYRQTLEVY